MDKFLVDELAEMLKKNGFDTFSFKNGMAEVDFKTGITSVIKDSPATEDTIFIYAEKKLLDSTGTPTLFGSFQLKKDDTGKLQVYSARVSVSGVFHGVLRISPSIKIETWSCSLNAKVDELWKELQRKDELKRKVNPASKKGRRNKL